ncbi:MAG: helix-turn-helix domain-containing protein [Hespellia sp.]|nr:helix-turn-helix domain-containing protein [Hespellia sp.]
MKVIGTDSLGKIIKQRRKELNYTQAFLAEFSGLSVSFLSDLENGKKTCEIGKVLRVVNLLGMDCLLTRRGEE